MTRHTKAILLATAIISTTTMVAAPAKADTQPHTETTQKKPDAFPLPAPAPKTNPAPPRASQPTIADQIGDSVPSPQAKPGEAIILSRSWPSLLEQCNLTPGQTRCIIQIPLAYDAPNGKQIIGMMLYSPKAKDNQLYIVISQKTDAAPVIYYPSNDTAKKLLASGNILDAGLAGLAKENPEKVQCTQEDSVCAYKTNMTSGQFARSFEQGDPLILSLSFAQNNHQIPVHISEMPDALKALSQDRKRTY